MGKDASKVTLKLPKAQQEELKRQGEELRRWMEIEKAAAEAPEIQCARRLVDDYIAVRDNQKRPAWMQQTVPSSPLAQQSKSTSEGGVGWKRALAAELLLKCHSRDELLTTRLGPTVLFRAVRFKYKEEHPRRECPFQIDVVRNALTEIRKGK
jgi:hypothetical protein